jgi:hypothetical protein
MKPIKYTILSVLFLIAAVVCGAAPFTQYRGYAPPKIIPPAPVNLAPKAVITAAPAVIVPVVAVSPAPFVPITKAELIASLRRAIDIAELDRFVLGYPTFPEVVTKYFDGYVAGLQRGIDLAELLPDPVSGTPR